jgi:hypothetical protein
MSPMMSSQDVTPSPLNPSAAHLALLRTRTDGRSTSGPLQQQSRFLFGWDS